VPNKIVDELKREVREIRQALTVHLIESGGIKARLDINTWLTGVILVALIGKWILEVIKN
jgi:hypothetical protein